MPSPAALRDAPSMGRRLLTRERREHDGEYGTATRPHVKELTLMLADDSLLYERRALLVDLDPADHAADAHLNSLGDDGRSHCPVHIHVNRL